MFPMIALLISLVAPIAPLPASDCETVGPRLDGTMVTICAGSVVNVSLK